MLRKAISGTKKRLMPKERKSSVGRKACWVRNLWKKVLIFILLSKNFWPLLVQGNHPSLLTHSLSPLPLSPSLPASLSPSLPDSLPCHPASLPPCLPSSPQPRSVLTQLVLIGLSCLQIIVNDPFISFTLSSNVRFEGESAWWMRLLYIEGVNAYFYESIWQVRYRKELTF